MNAEDPTRTTPEDSSPDAALDAAPATADRPFYGQPYWWLVFAVALCLVPFAGYLARANMVWHEIHPAINALLNGTGSVFLVAGYLAIRRRDEHMHKRCMLTSVGFSAVFLVSYLVRYATFGAHRYPGTGLDKTVYLIILFSHMVLAALALPLVARTIYLAYRERRAAHRRLARITLPVWLYVSITGVIVYVMLYHLADVSPG